MAVVNPHQAVAAVPAAPSAHTRNVKWTSSGGVAMPLVSDHANETAPRVGPTALKPEETAIARPLTRPRCARTHELLMMRKTEVKQVDWHD